MFGNQGVKNKNKIKSSGSDSDSGYEFFERSPSEVHVNNNDCIIDIDALIASMNDKKETDDIESDDDYEFYPESPSEQRKSVVVDAPPVIKPDCVIVIDHDITSSSSFNEAHTAFNALFMESVVHALNKHYRPGMSYLHAIKDVFYKNNHFSARNASMVTVSLAVGACSAVFYTIPARKAAEIIAEAFMERTGVALPGAMLLSIVMMTAATGYNVGVSSYSALQMIRTYTSKESKAEKFLTYHQATHRETVAALSRNTFNLICAIAAAVPNYVMTAEVSVGLAIVTSLANISLNWMGMSQLKIGPDKILGACKAEKYYLRDQLHEFIRLPFDRQNAILDELTSLARSKTIDKDLKVKKIYYRMLTLSESVNTAQNSIDVLDETKPTTFQKVFPRVVGGFGLTSEGLIFSSATGLGVASFFHNPNSPAAIAAALPAVLLALVQAIGVGYEGGVEAGKFMTTNKVELAHLSNPTLHTMLKWFLRIGSILSGGATFSTGCMVSDAFADAAKVTQPLADILKYTVATTGHLGISTINGYYVTKLLDEVLLYFAKRCGNEKVERLITFVVEMRKVQKILDKMSSKNYIDVLRWKLTVNPEDNYHQLSDLLKCILDDRLNNKEFARVMKKLDKAGYSLPGRHEMPKYQLHSDENNNDVSSLRSKLLSGVTHLFAAHNRYVFSEEMTNIRLNSSVAISK